MSQSNGLRVTMGVGYVFDLPVANHNRDLISKKQKIDWRSRLGVTIKEGRLFELPVVIIIVI